MFAQRGLRQGPHCAPKSLAQNKTQRWGRVVDLGIGAAHDGSVPTAESLTAALETALAPESRARPTAVAGTVAPTEQAWPRI